MKITQHGYFRLRERKQIRGRRRTKNYIKRVLKQEKKSYTGENNNVYFKYYYLGDTYVFDRFKNFITVYLGEV